MPRIAKVVDVPAIGELDRLAGQQPPAGAGPAPGHPSGRSESGRSAALDATAISGAASGTRHGIGSLRSANGGRLSRAAARLRHPVAHYQAPRRTPHANVQASSAVAVPLSSQAQHLARFAAQARALPPVPFTVSVPISDTAPDDVWRRLGNRVRARGPGARRATAIRWARCRCAKPSATMCAVPAR